MSKTASRTRRINDLMNLQSSPPWWHLPPLEELNWWASCNRVPEMSAWGPKKENLIGALSPLWGEEDRNDEMGIPEISDLYQGSSCCHSHPSPEEITFWDTRANLYRMTLDTSWFFFTTTLYNHQFPYYVRFWIDTTICMRRLFPGNMNTRMPQFGFKAF